MTRKRRLFAIALLALGSCGSEPPRRADTVEHAEARAQPEPEEAVEPAPEPAPPAGPVEPDFTAPFPAEACPDTRVRLAHRSAGELPPVLTHAVALRSEDGQHVRVLVADHPLERGPGGRFREPAAGGARFELDAVRTRRGPLEAGELRGPGARRGGLTHVRIVTAGPYLTFGHRDIGRVELSEVSAERVCGQIELDDGFGRVRGAFTAPVVGQLGE